MGACYACFDAYGDDPQLYGRVAALGRHKDGCRAAAVDALPAANFEARLGLPPGTAAAAFGAPRGARCARCTHASVACSSGQPGLRGCSKRPHVRSVYALQVYMHLYAVKLTMPL